MAKNNIRLETTQQKEIYSRFRYLADRYSSWQVWADFCPVVDVPGVCRFEEREEAQNVKQS